jgi:hypothetical protein
VTAKRGHLFAVPVSSCEPRSANEIPDPMTRSLTVRETRISAARAGALLGAADIADRSEVLAGNFFEQVPDRADCYVLANVLHINMLMITGGQERTNGEYGQLLRAAGLKPGRIHPVAYPYGVIEGVAATSPSGLA